MKIKQFFLFVFCYLLVFNVFSQPLHRYCQRLNGGQFLQLRNSSSLDLGTTFTMEAWIYLESASPYSIIMGKTFNPRSDNPFQNYVLAMDPSGLKVEFIQTTGSSGSYVTVTATNNLPLQQWTHVAAVLNSGKMKLYINGNLIGESTSPGPPLNPTKIPFSIGSGSTPTNGSTCCGFKGCVGEVRLWDTEQTQSQLKANNQKILLGNEAGLIAYWPLNDSVGQVCKDLTVKKFDLYRGNSVGTDGEDPIPQKMSEIGPFFSYVTIDLPSSTLGAEDLILIDWNSDGKKDLIGTQLKWPATNPPTYSKMLSIKNNGNHQYQLDLNGISGFDSLVHPRDFITADFNKDGKEDLFIADHGTDISPFPGGQNSLFLGSFTGKLIENNKNLPSVLDFSHNSAHGDFDGDGDLDIYVCNIWNNKSVGPRFLMNNGDGVFTVKTSNFPSNIANLNKVYMSSRAIDFDNDNDLDLVLGAVDNSGINTDLLLENNGSGSFTEVLGGLPNRYGNNQWGTVAIAVADLNNDGYQDLLMSTLYKYQTCQLQLLINNKNGTFSDSSKNIIQSYSSSENWIKWIEVADLNNDGWLDFVVAPLGGKPRLYFNKGRTKFEDMTSILNPGTGISSYRIYDLNGDGNKDIAFITFGRQVIIANNLKPYYVKVTPNPTVNTKNHGNEVFTVFPNPTKSTITIEAKNIIRDVAIKLYSLNGSLLKQWAIDQLSNEIIELKNYQTGTYILELASPNLNVTSRQILIIN